ncbi:hypothetical protein KMW28_13060 [Flammeovirga yaeyamensis]|uniref:Outer membrane protein beta-barrel domain-containing protein n=1 Tax=Flammeovirga yaeyamensis TaxID=367791 RepID=A0AAX1MZC0_9BACT|nr:MULTISPECIES: outer membrane beta-barrel protein [Flammeovirga]ANQ48017.1 hypothetical protein MY04_0635 [Flammeovirga sp. MY04]MBB3695899.1 hypothetical protein [Flammeovirga yaeyamensis]NMF34588.1 hypothetical protein [Flammeovirga yaeyamensis]QWG00582.1 hypothetical protein KMW28_13060 [Flammeovirga yaeyamensis]
MTKLLLKLSFTLGLLIIISNSVFAQKKHQFFAGYTSAHSVGDENTIDLKGAEIGWFYQIGNSNFNTGLGVGYLSSGKSTQNGMIGNGLISTNLKNIAIVPIDLKFNYTIHSGRFLTPYFGLNFSAYYMTNDIYISPLMDFGPTYSTTMSYWKYGLKPEVGVRSKVFNTINFYGAVEYNHLFDEESEYLNLRYLSLKVGLIF